MDQAFTLAVKLPLEVIRLQPAVPSYFRFSQFFTRWVKFCWFAYATYENIRKLCSCVFSMKQTLPFAPATTASCNVVMCQLSCFPKKNQLLFALILVRLDRYIPLRVLLKPENSSKNLHVRMDNKKCNTNLGSTDQSCHPTWISNRRWHNYLSSWIYDKSFKIGLWHSNQSS